MFNKYCNEKMVTRKRIGTLRNPSSHLCMEQQEMGRVLNVYFSSAFTAKKDVLRTICITDEEILDVHTNMKLDKSPEPEQIYPRKLLLLDTVMCLKTGG